MSAGFDWLFLAMAHHRLGHTDQARAFPVKSVTWMDAAMQDQAVNPSTGAPLDYDQLVELQTLRREVEELLKGPKP
jgi:hypothetical protein